MASLAFCSAHSGAGPHDVAFIEKDLTVHLVTCGGDGKLCYRSVSSPSETTKVIDVTDDAGNPIALTCLATSPTGTRVVVGDDQNFVKVYSFPEGELDHVATRFTLPARSAVYSAAGSTLAAAGDDDGIKLMDTATNKVFRTLKSPPYTVGLAYDPENNFVASLCADGTLIIWEITTGKALYTMKSVFSKSACSPKTRTLPAWHPDGGSMLAVPSTAGGIQLIERLSWEASDTLEGHSDHVNLLTFSKNGLYLASASKDGSLILWDVVNRAQMKKKLLAGAATGLAWHPSENSLAIITEDGELAVWSDVVPSDLPGPCVDVDAVTGVKKKYGNTGGLLDVEAGEADEGEEESDNEYDHDDSFIDGDNNTGAADPAHRTNKPNKARRRSKAARGLTHYPGSGAFYDSPAIELPQPQEAIQPGSTQLDSGRRYLAYTRTGCITSRSESDHNVIEVTFHDTSKVKRRVPLLSDFFGFTLGALGDKGALYASCSSSDSAATIMYRPFDPWAPNTDWSMTLPTGEEPLGLAAGATFCAVSTDKRRIRLFSEAGLQSHIFDLPGDAVALAAQDDLLAVAWHAAPSTPNGDQCIAYAVYDVVDGAQVQHGGLSLSPGSTLTWFGFSDEGVLAAYDSQGELRARSPAFGGVWVPIFSATNERKGAEYFWVFAVNAVEVQCIVCAGKPEPSVPSGSARPVVSAPPVRIPVLQHDDGMAPLEGDMVRHSLTVSHITVAYAAAEASGVHLDAAEHAMHAAQVEADRAALRLFTKLVQTDRQARAVEVAMKLLTQTAMQGALKIAHHHRLSALAEKLEAIIEGRAAAEAAAVQAQAYADIGGGWPAEQQHQEVQEEEEAEDRIVSPFAEGGKSAAGGGPQKAGAGGAFGSSSLKEKENTGGAGGIGGKRKTPSANPFARKKAAK